MGRKFEPAGQDDRVKILRLETEPFGTNAYIVTCRESGDSLLIDAPGNADLITDQLKGSSLKGILVTHGHMDHIMALEELVKATGAPLAAHGEDARSLPVSVSRLLQDGDIIECGRARLETMHVPGHTAGSLCFRAGDFLISGDALFPGGPGKTATPENFRQIITSIREKLLSLPDRTIVLPGHGEATTIGRERPLVEDFLARGYDEDLCGDVTWS